MIGLPEAVLAFGGSLIAVFTALSLFLRERAENKQRNLVREKIAATMTQIYNVSNEQEFHQIKRGPRPTVIIRMTETVKAENNSTNS